MELCSEGMNIRLALLLSVTPSSKESCGEGQGNQFVVVKIHKDVLNHNEYNEFFISHNRNPEQVIPTLIKFKGATAPRILYDSLGSPLMITK